MPQPKKKTDKTPYLFKLGGKKIGFSQHLTLSLPVAELYTDTPIKMPVKIATGAEKGPVLFITGAVHGDEIIGVEVIRRLLQHPVMYKIQRGAIIALPILNLFGFLLNSRYLPDRRDLNRSFPGSPSGSLASRMAHLFSSQIMSVATHGIDIHAGSFYRENLPQIRANTNDDETATMARAFAAPVIINSDVRDGSLREAASDKNIKILVYEAGEALRFDEKAAQLGVDGIISVMTSLGMVDTLPDHPVRPTSLICRHTLWVRAPRGGILWDRLPLGTEVRKGDVLAMISDPFGEDAEPILSPENGLIIGRSNLPTANEGDGLFHIATFGKTPKNEADLAEDDAPPNLAQPTPPVR